MNIRIQNLSKKYGDQKAVDDISFEVKTGEILGFLGPNGAGTSTTMKMITHYLNIEEGDILIDGRSIKNVDMKRHIGYLPEHNPLYDEMPVIDYLEFVAELQGVHKDRLNEQVKKMIRLCGLNDEKHKKINELSKGYRQRVGLAQAMIHDPEILVLDEPTTGLDPNQIVEIRQLIRTLGNSKTVILSTHILPEVEATCDRILIINKGKIVADGTADTLRKTAAGSQVLKIRIQAPDQDEVLNAVNALPSVSAAEKSSEGDGRIELQSKADSSSNEEVFKLCVDKNWVLTEMIPFETKLEDIFRDLTMN